jgi:3-dehydro-L-gulonate-6-phosphate decarboxylase
MQRQSIPLLQLALDYISLPPAIAMALQVAPYVDVIEIGTPLCKAAGIEAVRAVREVCPDKLILADLKTPDVGDLEAKMAFEAGADMMTVIGGAALATVELALKTAKEMGKEMLMELTGVRDIIARAKEWKQVGVERMVYHRGWDEQTFQREWEEEDKRVIRQLIDMGFKVTVTGGITVELLPFFQDLPVSIIIAGRAIHQSADPPSAALEMRSAIARLWGGPGAVAGVRGSQARGGNKLADLAAKAIRYGVSEMGLLLTVDGRDCPGCDSPQRFCPGTLTEIHVPDGVRVDDLVRDIGQIIGESGAFGRVSNTAFYLDPAQLSGLSHDRVIDLLIAVGNAVRQSGYAADVNAGVGVANRILVSI